MTPLLWAVFHGRLNSVRLLLDRGANVNVQDWNGETVLIFGIEQTFSPDLVRLLLAHGATVNVQDTNGWTALFMAVCNGSDKDIISQLLAHGADPNLADKDGNTPLSVANRIARTSSLCSSITERRSNHRRAALLTLGLLTGLIAVSVVLTWREVRQQQLNQALITAVRCKDAPTVVTLLKHGAAANAREGNATCLRDKWRCSAAD